MSHARSTTLVITRHGETDWNRAGLIQGQQDTPLNDIGLAQAKAAARAIATYQPEAIYSSDLQRAMVTARMAAARLGISVRDDAGLRERRLGMLEGKTIDQFRRDEPALYGEFRKREPDFALPGSESLAEFHRRSVTAVESIAARHPGETVAIVTHGGVLGAILRETLGMAIHTRRNFSLDNACIAMFRRWPDYWYLLRWGLVDHLPAELTAQSEAVF